MQGRLIEMKFLIKKAPYLKGKVQGNKCHPKMQNEEDADFDTLKWSP
jgi:hypothetical protein